MSWSYPFTLPDYYIHWDNAILDLASAYFYALIVWVIGVIILVVGIYTVKEPTHKPLRRRK